VNLYFGQLLKKSEIGLLFSTEQVMY
jgi:hypothetical protein